MKTHRGEQETIIHWYQDDDAATVNTSSYSMMKRYDKCVEKGDWECIKTEYCEGDIVSKTYRVPKNLVYGRTKKNIRDLRKE